MGVGVEQAEQSSRPEQRRHSSSFTRPGIRGEEKKFALDLGRRGGVERVEEQERMRRQ